MRYLLDTNIMIFMLGQDGEISHDVEANIFIIAHAITNRIPLISSDRRFDFYTNQGRDFIYNKR